VLPSSETTSEKSWTRTDSQGRVWTEKTKTYENLRDKASTTVHSRYIDGKGIKSVKTKDPSKNIDEEHKDLKGINENELNQFEKQWQEGTKSGAIENKALGETQQSKGQLGSQNINQTGSQQSQGTKSS